MALALCSKASSAAAKQTGQAAADAFNNVFSVASQPPRKSGSAIAAASDSSQGAVTSSDSGGSAATATSSADSSASTSTGDGRKPNGVRKGQDGGKNRGNGGSDGNKGSSSTGDPALSLLAANVQSASDTTGIQGQGSEKAQAASATDPANFINFCTGKTLTNGLQVKSGSCNGIVMGDIPSTAKMVSQIITFPENGKTSNLKAKQTFKIKVQTNNLEAGSFTNPDNT